MKLSDLRYKEVINECDCRRLGSICDVEFDCKTGCICSFIVPGQSKFCGLFGRDTEIVIPFKCVKQIGDDIVLVCVEESACTRRPSGSDHIKDNFFGF